LRKLLRKRHALFFAVAMLAPMGGALGAAPADLVGSWSAKQNAPAGAAAAAPSEATLTFARNGDALSGVMRAGGEEFPLYDVKETGSAVSFTMVIPGTPYLSLRYSGSLAGNTLNLTSDDGQGHYALSAVREGPAPSPPARTAAAPPPQRAAVQTAPRPPANRVPPPPSAAPPQATGQAIQGSYITQLLNQLPPAPAQSPAPSPPAPAPVMRGAPVPPATAPLMQGAPVPPSAAPAEVASVEPSRPSAPPAPPPPPKPSYDLAGEWTAQQSSPGSAAPVDAKLTFVEARGTMRVGNEEWPLFDVKGSGNELSFTLVIPGSPYITIRYRGTVTGNEMMLASLDEGQGVFALAAHRDAALEPTPPAKPEPHIAEAPKEPPPAAPVIAAPEPSAAKPVPSIVASATSPAASPTSTVIAPPPVAALPPPPPASTVTAPPSAPAVSAPPPSAPTLGTPAIQPPAPVPAAAPPSAVASATPASTPEATLIQRAPAAPSAPAATAPALASVTPSSPPVIQPPRATPPAPTPPAPHVAKALARAPLAMLPAKLPLPALREVAANPNAFKTPPMGWASRGKLGTLIDADAIREAADSLNEGGLKAAGYTLVEVDDGWQGERDITGALQGNDNFPDMKGLVDYVHGRGLKFGLLTSAAPLSCGGFEGSYGHEEEDAKTLASWGVDYVIYDWCGAEKIYPTQAEQQAAFQKMAEAVKASGRDVAFAVSQGGAFDVASWATKAGANLWRAGEDVSDSWKSVVSIGFTQNSKEGLAGPGHWSDPGLVQFGNSGMSADEYRTQLNLWALLAAPLMLGSDTRIASRDTIAALNNPEVIAVDQDPKGIQGKRVAQAGQTEIWARTLADGSVVVGLFNKGDASAPVAVSWEQLGLMGPRQVRDLWWHQNLGTASDRYAVFLAPHASLLLKLSR
jgi:alpha-galactosidase